MGEIVSTHIKVTEGTTLAKLSIWDQFKLLIRKFSNDDVAELDAAEKLSGASARMRASLMHLINTATKEIKEGRRHSVTIAVSSKYLPYIDEVIDPVHGEGQFYEFIPHYKDLPPNIEYKFPLEIRKKVT